jgi:hypothetical protein
MYPDDSIETGPAVWFKTMLRIAVFLFVGAGLGYCSAQTAIIQGIGVTSIRLGPWTAWPNAGSPKADPYTRAHFAYSGELPLSSFEAVIFRAARDSDGNALEANCEYRVSGQPIDTRWWSLTVYAGDGTLIKNPSDRYSYNANNVLLNTDGSFTVALSRQARTGNWVPLGLETTEFFVTLRLFGLSQTLLADISKVPVPRIVKGQCL